MSRHNNVTSGQLGRVLLSAGFQTQPVYGANAQGYYHPTIKQWLYLPLPPGLVVPSAFVMACQISLDRAGILDSAEFDARLIREAA